MDIKQEIPTHYFLFEPFFSIAQIQCIEQGRSSSVPPYFPSSQMQARRTLLIHNAETNTTNHIDFTHQSNMGIAPRIKTSWASMRVKKGLSSRGSIIHIVVLVLLFSTFAYIIWLPIFYLFQTFQDASSHQKQPVILEPGDE
jgi:hypothetical protein